MKNSFPQIKLGTILVAIVSGVISFFISTYIFSNWDHIKEGLFNAF